MLYLDETRVTNVGLAHLKGLSRLQQLHLDGTSEMLGWRICKT
jgi:hypothetical protein